MELASSSSSSSSSFLKSKPHFIYDVFINFWGEEMQRKFVSHLHSVLLQAQVKTLINMENLEEGMQLEEHMRAIASSKIAIIVFSKTYTESTCCLRELEKIIECRETFGQIVLPVFYEIDPFDVRHQKDDFRKALEESAQKSYSGEQLEHVLSRWSRALTTAAGINGWDVTDFRHDAELVEVAVSRVQTLLGYEDLSHTEFPVGLESHVEKMVGSIENHSAKVCMVGIWGMGGSGKTTIAKAIYNQIYRQFIGKSFIENVGQVHRHIGLEEELIYQVLKPKFKWKGDWMGRTIVKNELSNKKLLIVLDDVNKFWQLQNVCGNHELFGQGTVIIITTRDVRLLNKLKLDFVYKMDLMNENDSLELLCWHAFRDAKPRKNFNELARKIVTCCGGLPQALVALGSDLYLKTFAPWEPTILPRQIFADYHVLENLEKSFDGLCNYMQRDIFLDVCCFFIGKDRGYVTKILNDCGLRADIGITVLIQRGLIKVERNNKLQMHPLLQDMGREIICRSWPMEPEKRSRLWFHEDVKHVLRNKTGTAATEGLSLKLHSTRDCFKADTFKEMKRLRLLELDHVQLVGDYGYLSEELRWICWKGFPSQYIPDNFRMKNVIAIDLKHSHLQLVWKQAQVLKWLKFLNLSHSKYLRETPDFAGLPSLEQLILKDCPSLCKVHPSIGDLCNILLINLKDCTSLSSLPKEVYKLKSLQTFILSGCLKIDILEEDIVQMKSLITLVSENTAVKQVPCTIVNSKHTGYISLRRFEGLSHNILSSIIRSWMSPIMNSRSYIRPLCIDMENDNLRDLAPLLSCLANIRSILVQCDTQSQLSKQLNTIFVEDGVNFTESTNHSLRFSLIGVGSCNEFLNTVRDSVSKGLESSECCDISLPCENNPYWLGHTGEGHSVSFSVPKDCDIKGMTLCVVYSSTPEIVATECLRSVLIVNYTKCTYQIHKHGTVMSFNDEDWHGIISNLESEDKVEIFVSFGHGLVVKNTTVYFINREPVKTLSQEYERFFCLDWLACIMQPFFLK
ncbi:TMV resistance protein N-like [Vigna radiata var. radiata]|uniref:TMV resistance protein N-like n=1 Tax=Vigna radiata var. radiata TaxID=3916 RepID=A0A3Q0ETU6_VIGRR|nr:TMV resistance protein N-like [Vigna radiata var. radiata]